MKLELIFVSITFFIIFFVRIIFIIICYSKLYAVDRCKERYNIMQKMLEKYGVKNVETFNMDALTFPYFDDVKYILVDPSCSGSGKFIQQKNPYLCIIKTNIKNVFLSYITFFFYIYK